MADVDLRASLKMAMDLETSLKMASLEQSWIGKVLSKDADIARLMQEKSNLLSDVNQLNEYVIDRASECCSLRRQVERLTQENAENAILKERLKLLFEDRGKIDPEVKIYPPNRWSEFTKDELLTIKSYLDDERYDPEKGGWFKSNQSLIDEINTEQKLREHPPTSRQS